MVQYQTIDQFHRINFSVEGCSTPKEAEKLVKEWLQTKPKLNDKTANQNIQRLVFNE